MSKTYLATLDKDGKLDGSQIPSNIYYGGKMPTDDYHDVWCDTGPDYLCFTAEQANSTVAMAKQGSPADLSLQYSFDKINWVDFIPTETTITLANVGDKVYIKGNNSTISSSYSNYYKYTMTGLVAASGDITSMLDETMEKDSVSSYCYVYMFYGCSALTRAPKLPATTLNRGCYSYMFRECSSLTQAPELLATTLAMSCYTEMFEKCTSLTQAPKLPATQLAVHCYSGMFWSCASLTQAPELPATTLAQNCYYQMFNSCSSLTQTPKLLATTLVQSCYQAMFANCTNIKLSTTQDETYKYPYRIPTEGEGTTASSALDLMFYNTGGSFKGTPSINTTYYTDHEPV